MAPAAAAHLAGVARQLDAAGLAPAADLDLGLDHDRVPGLVGLDDGLLDRVGHPTRRCRYAESMEVLLPLVLVEIHPLPFS